MNRLFQVATLLLGLHSSLACAEQPIVTLAAEPLVQTVDAETSAVTRLELRNHDEKSVLFGAVRGAFSYQARLGKGECEYDIKIADEYGHKPDQTALGTQAAKHFVTSTYILNLEGNGSVVTVVDVGSLYHLTSGHTYSVEFLFKKDHVFLVSADGQRLPLKIAAMSNKVTFKVE